MVGCSGTADCTMVKEVIAPAGSTATSGVSVLTPAVSSQSRPHWSRSRPLAFSSSTMRSLSSVFRQACLLKYSRTPDMNCSGPDPGNQLAQHRGALGVGDAVEVHLDVLQVVDLGEDRVRGGQLVLAVRPRLLHGSERGPGVVKLGVLHRSQVGHVLGERFVEPQVIPPAHRHEVAEPHVREFMQHGDGPAFDLRARDLAAEHIAFQDGDGTRVLHRPGIELRDEELVVLLERVRAPELCLEELETLAGEFEDVVRVEVLHERLPREHSQRDNPSVGALHLAAHGLVRAGDQCRHIRGKPREWGETPRRNGHRRPHREWSRWGQAWGSWTPRPSATAQSR